MPNFTDRNLPQIMFYRNSKKVIEGELFVKQHAIEYIISGTSEVHFGGKSHFFKAGDYRFAVKNRLSRFVKHPPANGEYCSISIFIDEDTLTDLSAGYMLQKNQAFDNLFALRSNELFKIYIDSLKPYLENNHHISGDLIRVKIKEAVLIFTGANPELKQILFDFREPGKIDLEAYMNEHYRFNGDLHHFAYLTGRSISTFKRDFEKIFGTSPTRWLVQRRLEDAHYLLREKNWRASDVYLEVGFKDYSHFSNTFKKAFGVSPSVVSSVL